MTNAARFQRTTFQTLSNGSIISIRKTAASAPIRAFLCLKQEIADNDYDLSINKYKKVEYVPVEYPSTAEIMAALHELEMEITEGLAELEEML